MAKEAIGVYGTFARLFFQNKILVKCISVHFPPMLSNELFTYHNQNKKKISSDYISKNSLE